MALGIPALYQDFQVTATSILSTISAISSIFKKRKVYAVVDKDGNSILEWDSCISFEYKNSYTISDAPQESGAFISYNKVASPFVITTRGTSLASADRIKFIRQADKVLAGLELYSFITPENIYRNINLIAISHAKTASSGYAINAIDFVFHEVVLNDKTREETRTAEPSGATHKSTGQVVAK